MAPLQTIGKKKTAIAHAKVATGSGSITVNGVPLNNVRPELLRAKVEEPMRVAGPEYFAGLDIDIHVHGGGSISQLYAVRQAITRGLIAHLTATASGIADEVRSKLVRYDRSLLVSDSRRAEAKKFGGRSARTRRQKSYR